MDVKTLSATLGHVSAATTLDIYSHVTSTMQKQAAVNIEKAIGKSDVEYTPEEAKPVAFLVLSVMIAVLFPLQRLWKLHDGNVYIPSPNLIIERLGANHFGRWKQLVLPGVADTSVNGPVTLAHLCQHPTNKLLAPVDFVGLAAILPIGLIYCLTPLG